MSATELPPDVHANDEPVCYAAKISLLEAALAAVCFRISQT